MQIKSHVKNRRDENSVSSRWSERGRIVIRNRVLHININEINIWQKTVISLDKFQPLILKIMDVSWQNPGVTSDIHKFK
jgi:hypothetical protein